MTSDTSAELRAAIADYVAEVRGGMLTGFYLIGDYLDEEGRECWFNVVGENQGLNKTVGLATFAKADVDYMMQRYLAGLYESDDEEEDE